MTNEELEKTIQFILEQQAQFAVNQQQLNERVTRLETNMAEMARAQTHMNEVLAVMADTHRHTEEKLEAFIGVLERYISNGKNGEANGESAT
jgi:3-phenylpropionate/cinnamic acid dioxygenase small subunit